ncbi:hypothetical protein [Streptomyces sp. NPDC048419]|uniref:hypothetical protein n=1 Tax=Streptomyces sp. NPDC048419 TaxID=3365547 RepID=UPI003714F896
MVDKLKKALPLALAVGVLAFAWIEVSMNFTFHWFDNGALGNGLGLPANFHLIAPAAFISWAMVFAAGADAAAATKVGIATAIGSVAGLVLMALGPKTADLPEFWGLALWVGVLAFGAVALSIFDWYYTPAALAAFAAVVFWWIATGLDGWASHGGGGWIRPRVARQAGDSRHRCLRRRTLHSLPVGLRKHAGVSPGRMHPGVLRGGPGRDAHSVRLDWTRGPRDRLTPTRIVADPPYSVEGRPQSAFNNSIHFNRTEAGVNVASAISTLPQATHTGIYGDGEWRDAALDRTLEVEDPATGSRIAVVADAEPRGALDA